jgi:hypothetical protein
MEIEIGDTLKKREQFAVSLRKIRKSEIIKQKRLRLIGHFEVGANG